MVHPARIVTNAGGRPGDLLVLTKPLGLGIITTAAKQDRDDEGAIAEAIPVMATLNRSASDAMSTVPVHACTDVTGFGLLGHLRNLAAASECSAVVWVDAVPVLAAAWRYVRAGVAPGGTHANWRFLQDWATYAADVAKDAQLVLSDAQTSGGLLIAVSPDDVDALLDALQRRATLAAAVVGALEAGPPGRMRVLAARLPAATKAG
jgi:selenide,water dikinase